MKKKDLEKEIELRLIRILKTGEEVNDLFKCYIKKASKKEFKKFLKRMSKKYEADYERVFLNSFDS
jgi:hypothetical protein